MSGASPTLELKEWRGLVLFCSAVHTHTSSSESPSPTRFTRCLHAPMRASRNEKRQKGGGGGGGGAFVEPFFAHEPPCPPLSAPPPMSAHTHTGTVINVHNFANVGGVNGPSSNPKNRTLCARAVGPRGPPSYSPPPLPHPAYPPRYSPPPTPPPYPPP